MTDETIRPMHDPDQVSSYMHVASPPVEHAIFPQEIWDDIIDHLHSDKAALRQCILVCKNWVPSASLHLYNPFSWPPSNAHLVKQRMGMEDVDDYSLLARLLATPSLNYVRIYTRQLSLGRDSIDFHETIPVIDVGTLLRILNLLPSLDSLSLSNCEPTITNLADMPNIAVLRTFKRVEFVCAEERMSSIEGTLHLVRTLRSISSLIISAHFTSASASAFTVPAANALVKVENLRIDLPNFHIDFSSFFTALSAVLDLDALQKLSFIEDDGIPPELSLDLMPNLAHIIYVPDEQTPKGFSKLRLHSLKMVSSLRLYLREECIMQWAPIIRDLHAVSPFSLRQITVFIIISSLYLDEWSSDTLRTRIMDCFDREKTAWESLNGILLTFPILESFCITLIPGLENPIGEEARLALETGVHAVIGAKLSASISPSRLQVEIMRWQDHED